MSEITCNYFGGTGLERDSESWKCGQGLIPPRQPARDTLYHVPPGVLRGSYRGAHSYSPNEPDCDILCPSEVKSELFPILVLRNRTLDRPSLTPGRFDDPG
jgi:hypothetical protein